MEQKVIDTLRKAAVEIRFLRQQNTLLAARVEVIEFFEVVLNTQPCSPRARSMSIDAAYELECIIKEEEKSNG